MPETSADNSTLGEKSVPPSVPADRIVFFDGVCGLCNYTINFLLKRDTKEILQFAPLQGTTATEVLCADVRKRLDTIVYYRDGQLYYRSTAVLQILRDLGGVSGLFAVLLLLIPRFVRDFGYRCISASRYRLFGRYESCRIPTPEERARFLN
ncbi:MAG: DCC1-like thiol-disulfide oxidoreductase family protein [Fuerstiella sp.]|nr:DCC1-like thiol-disulfide oxidoreductase family protein [Fuerstiella sp.]